MSDTLQVMLVHPHVTTSDGTILQGTPGAVMHMHWAEARAAEAMGHVVVLDDFDTEARTLLTNDETTTP